MIEQEYENGFGTDPKELVRTTDPDTSHEAALTVDTSYLESLVYDIICKHPNGCIADDVERELYHLRSHSITPRFAPLLRKGFIVDTGERRMASSGRSQRVVKALIEAKPNEMNTCDAPYATQ